MLDNPRSEPIAPRTVTIMTMAAGLAVANVYAIQPLLDMVGDSLAMTPANLGRAVMVTQLGYAVGLIVLVPLGDVVDRRRLILCQTALSALALAATALAGSAMGLFIGLAAVGLLAVTVQTLVAYAGALAPPDQRGGIVGKVTGGVVVGILAARFISGAIGDMLGWRQVYLISALVSAIAAILLCASLPADPDRLYKQSYVAVLRSMPGLLKHDPVLRLRAFFAFIIFAAFSIFWTAMVLPLTRTPYHFSHMQVGLFGVVGLAGTFGARHAGKLADGGHGEVVTGLALALLCLSWLAIAQLPTSLLLLGIGIVALDLAVQAVHVTNQTLIVSRHPTATGRVIGAYMIFYSLGSATGAALSTFAYARSGWSGVCMLGAGVSLIGLALWSLTRKR